jgi:NADH-quinone oxidoreductase subunit G
MADDVTLTIDGREVTVPAGTNVADAARSIDIAIPVFCYHPRMKAVGMCRMCLVAVGTPKMDRSTGAYVLDAEGKPEIMMMPKLQTACTTTVSQGMIVHTSTDEVKYAQRGILEFLLTSHPLDCPVCDKGGECPLQNLTMEWGPGESRFDYADKIHFEKPVRLGNLILLDRERCILCGRCVRFQDQIADDPVLGFDQRGRAWHIITMSEPPFDSKFSGNTTDICPVGALTTADFRFRARAWEVTSVPSLCLHCPVTCNITLDMRHNEIKRVMPRENSFVNDIWICDKGRFAQRFVENDTRLTTPLIRQGNELIQASWEEALELIAERFAALHRNAGADALAGLAGDRLSNEDLYLFQRLFRDVLGSNNLDHRAGTPADLPLDDSGLEVGVGSGTNLMSLGAGTTVLLIGGDPEEEAPIYLLRLREIAQRGGDIIVANSRATKLDRSAAQVLHYQPGTEQQLIHGLMLAVLEQFGSQKLPPRTSGMGDLRSTLNTSVKSVASATGIAEDTLRTVARQLAETDNGIIVYGADAMRGGAAIVQDIASLALLTGNVGRANSGLLPLLRRGNTRGALDMGIRPDRKPGYQPLREGKKTHPDDVSLRGLTAREMWGAAIEGRVRGMYLAGIDPVAEYPNIHEPLEKLEFLVVQDMFLTPTAALAHVVLPTMSFAERDGTYTNAERRVQRARQARPAVGTARADWEIVRDLAQALIERGVAPQAPPTAGEDQPRGQAQAGAPKQPRRQEQAEGEDWMYFTIGDVTMEIAERVPGYTGITPTALTRTGKHGTWGRQTNESFYYDGTSYTNIEGIGIQYPTPAEKPNASFSRASLKYERPAKDSNYPFLLQIQTLLYDSDPLLTNSLLESHVPEPYAILHPTDAEQHGIQQGQRVQITSSTGSLELVARVDDTQPQGSVRVPDHIAGAPLSKIQTGAYTRVAIKRL